MKRSWFRLLSAVLCVCLLFSVTAVPAFAVGTEGSVGDGLSWKVDSSGCLTISGEGAIPDYSAETLSHSPWYDVRESVTEVVIGEGVTEIGDYSLFDMRNVTSVKLPRTLERIGGQAMAYMRNLTSLQVPSGVTWLGGACFGNCTSLTTLYVYNPNTVFEYLPYGYRYDSDADDYLPISGVTLYGYGGSTAQAYANANWNVSFVSLGGGAISGSVVKDEVMERTDSRDLIHIYSVEDLKKVSDNPSGNYILENDLELSADWAPLELYGSFDGQGHTISSLSVTQSIGGGRYGLFGTMSGTVSNLTVVGEINAEGEAWIAAGLLAGECTGTVVNCRTEGTVTVVAGDLGAAGLLTGRGGTYVNCHAEGTVQLTTTAASNWAFAGGLSGTYVDSALDCSFNGDVTLTQPVSAPNLKAEVRGIASMGTDACVNCTVSGSLTMDMIDCHDSGAIGLERAVASENHATVTATAEGDIYAHGLRLGTACVNRGDISATSTGDSGTSNAAGLMQGDGGQNYGTITAYSNGVEAVAQGISGITGTGAINGASVTATAPNGQAAAKGIEGYNIFEGENTGEVYARGYNAAAIGFSGGSYSVNRGSVTAVGMGEYEDSESFTIGVSSADYSANYGAVYASGALLNQAFGCRDCDDSTNAAAVTVRTSENGNAVGVYYGSRNYNSGAVSAVGSGCSGKSYVFACGQYGSDCTSSAHVTATSDGSSRDPETGVLQYGKVWADGSASVSITHTHFYTINQSGDVEKVYNHFDSVEEFVVETENTAHVDWVMEEPPEQDPASRAGIISAGFYYEQDEEAFIPAMTNALGSFLFYNGKEADIRDPESTDYSRVYLKVTVANLDSRPSATGTLNLTLPDGFSFSADNMMTDIPLDIEAMEAGAEEDIWLAVYPLYSLNYSDGAELTCSCDDGSVPTGCAINLPTERVDYAKINYDYDKALSTYRFAYYQWDASMLNKDNTQFHKELNQLAAMLSMIIYFTDGREADALAAMESLGFSCVRLGGEVAFMNYPHIVAQKMVVTEDGQLQQLVITSVLGTLNTTLHGWIGNFSFSEVMADHASFLSVAQNAYHTLDEFLGVYSRAGGEQKLLITGHSRGAASANLLADLVNQQYASNWENIYAYTFATPHTSRPEVVAAMAQRNTNIFNISNFYDLVGYVPGCYDLHGNTIYYRVTEDVIAPLYISTLRTLSWERAAVSSEAQLALGVGLTGALTQINRILKYHLMRYYIEDIWLSTADTYMDYDTAIAAMKAEYDRIMVVKGLPTSLSMTTLLSMMAEHALDSYALDGAMEMQRYNVEYTYNPALSGVSGMMPTDIASFVENPANNLSVQVNCPVDLEIYDGNGTLIGQVTDDEAVLGSDQLILSVVGNKKTLNLLSDRTYIIKITGYEEGTMDLTMLLTGLSEEEDKLQQYRNLPVSPSVTLIARVENGELTLLDGNQQQLTPELTEGGELQQVTISVEDHESALFSTGGGTYYVGEQVVLTAAPAGEGTVFHGWYCEDELFSTAQTVCFVCEEELTLTPKFGAPEDAPAGDGGDPPSEGGEDTPPEGGDTPPEGGDLPPASPTGFYQAWGDKILDPEGNETLIKGISFGNCIFGNPSDYHNGPMQDHDAYSYYEIAEMGLDHVRFEMNYGLFESDEDPAVTVDENGNFQVDRSKYKESGFEWIDMNLEWAKAAGVNLLLQIELPQGGYQASTDVMAPGESWEIANGGKNLWIDMQADGTANYETEHYKLNQQRLIELWKEIARRYADEPCIVGYGLLNEPVVPQVKVGGVPNKDATLDQLRDLYQRIVDAIRTVDENHIIFTQCLISWFDPDNYNATDWNLMDLSETQVLLDDDNIVYQFHFFEPFAYTHQGADWMPQYQNMVTYYPSDNISGSNLAPVSLQETSPTGQEEGDWVYFESPWITSGSTEWGTFYNCAQPQICAENMGDSSAWFDDIRITKKDKDGNTSVVYSYSFNDGTDGFSNAFLGSGTYHWDDASGHNGPGSICISGADVEWSNVSSWDTIYLDPEYTYQISGWVKGGSGAQYPQFSLLYADQVLPLNRDYVEHMLQTYAQFGEEHNVPLFSGSWGFYYTCYERGGEEYLRDVTELYEEYGISSNYHSYHDSTFGLYLSESWQPVEYRNETLYEMLAKYYGKVEEPDTGFVGATFENGVITAYIQGVQSGKLLAAVYNEAGQFRKLVETVVEIPEMLDHTNGFRPVIRLNCESVELEEGEYFCLFLIDEHYRPLCPKSDPIS